MAAPTDAGAGPPKGFTHAPAPPPPPGPWNLSLPRGQYLAQIEGDPGEGTSFEVNGTEWGEGTFVQL